MVAFFWSSKMICILQTALHKVGRAIFCSLPQLKNVAATALSLSRARAYGDNDDNDKKELAVHHAYVHAAAFWASNL